MAAWLDEQKLPSVYLGQGNFKNNDKIKIKII